MEPSLSLLRRSTTRKSISSLRFSISVRRFPARRWSLRCSMATTTLATPTRTVSRIRARRSSSRLSVTTTTTAYRILVKLFSLRTPAIRTRMARKIPAKRSSTTTPATPTITASRTPARRSSSTSTIRRRRLPLAASMSATPTWMASSMSAKPGNTQSATRRRRTTSTTAGAVTPGLTHDNTATGTTTQGANDEDTVSVPVVQDPRVSIVKAASVADGTADAAGDVINYTIDVSNTGNMTLTDVQVTDPSVSNLTLVSGDTN